MAKKIKPKNPVPDSLELWVAEIAMAYRGSEQFMKLPMVSSLANSNNMQPWHVAPLMALGARGLADNEDLLDDAAGYAYSSFEQNYSIQDAESLPPSIAFAFVYVGAHLGINLIDEKRADEILDLVEANQDALDLMIEKAGEMFKDDNPFNFFFLEGGAPATEPIDPQAKKGRKPATSKKKEQGEATVQGEATGQIYALEISLRDIKPRIWRRVCVPAEITLDRLSEVIKIVMGWGYEHLHEFEIGEESYGVPDPDDPLGATDDMLDQSEYRLCDLVHNPGEKFRYTYDFGDDWQHEIVVKRIEPPKEGVEYPLCEAGKRACPPEDCGGPFGYGELQQAVIEPQNQGQKDILEWVGGKFDPEAFDLKEINRRLHQRIK